MKLLGALLIAISSSSALANDLKFDANDRYYVCGQRTNMYDYLMIVDTKKMTVFLDSNVATIGESKITSLQKLKNAVTIKAAYKNRGYTGQNRIEISKKRKYARAVIVGADDTYPGEYYSCASVKKLAHSYNYLMDKTETGKFVDDILKLSPIFPFTHTDYRRPVLDSYDL